MARTLREDPLCLRENILNRWKNDRTGYIFEEYEPYNTFMQYSHHVIATHLSLQLLKRRGSRRQRWKLGINDHERLLEVLSLRADPHI